MRKPNFLIVGAAKSGTTSLFEYLRGHPDVFMPDIKEASFFAGDGGRTEADYFELFRDAGSVRAVGEASVAYLYPPNTAVAIREKLGPDARIVIILRNPIDMAYSLWGHLVREGREELSFFDALGAEQKRLTDPAFHRSIRGWPFDFAYADRARYARQVAGYLRTFGRNQVEVLIFEEFFADPAGAFADLCRFLDVSPDYRPAFQVFNQSRVVRFKRVRDFMEKPSIWKDAFQSTVPSRLRLKLKNWLNDVNYKSQPLPALSSADRQSLWGVFESDVAELEALLGRRIDCWGPGLSTSSVERPPAAVRALGEVEAHAAAQSLDGLRPTFSARKADGQCAATGQLGQAGLRAVQMRRP
jgi:hypothetical protein